MKWIILRFKIWRRQPYKRAVSLAFEKGIINSRQLHEIADLIDKA